MAYRQLASDARDEIGEIRTMLSRLGEREMQGNEPVDRLIARGLGIGLVAESEENGVWTLQAGVFPENVASVASASATAEK